MGRACSPVQALTTTLVVVGHARPDFFTDSRLTLSLTLSLRSCEKSGHRSVTVAARKHAAMPSTAYRAASVNERLHKRFLHGFSRSRSRLGRLMLSRAREQCE